MIIAAKLLRGLSEAKAVEMLFKESKQTVVVIEKPYPVNKVMACIEINTVLGVEILHDSFQFDSSNRSNRSIIF